MYNFAFLNLGKRVWLEKRYQKTESNLAITRIALLKNQKWLHSPTVAVIASSKTYIGWDKTAYMDTATHFTRPSWHKSQTDTGCCFSVPAWRLGIDFLPVLLPQVIYSFNLIGVQELWGSDVYWDVLCIIATFILWFTLTWCQLSTLLTKHLWSQWNNVTGKL